ncbi:bifunctional dTDP-4-dehydrorhamnose 3,5-epimerase family protein/NAD(P)-dependent oxidoreductase [Corynebacterium sp.]|uniref:bifunctional dTDP-4-dehydrorhamnose 3,5-epimerase family protein/NAD(P)-dependent oxidoreductase n=1 Tax=Corynebacterium sp. TaxID=1720 RepID=UPI0026DC48BD|nr:bifunctional dTDP-4-dehydrorhamnose 3,5-epimerase family protein/NAD(P)-dependent oxidoreductase [Corynebacterium sp.]MDO5031895.1 bifunctional dTDP-4-dehydrorhamnose 3,5-epimerase family protein/NAD(P)-dependent oxidoreductase [Corynebacterium sp.]
MKVTPTPIEGLLIVELDVHGDNRGWFKENWQREKMVAAGLPDFQPVQNNVSHNAAGVTRGLHAEPWDKLVSVASGRAFGAWCDLREGSETYGQLVTHELRPDVAVFVPRGVANGFQALEECAYSYLVNDHWSPEATYTCVNLGMVDWPLEPTEISEKDKAHPQLAAVSPMPARRILVTGANGQLGRALKKLLPAAGLGPVEFCTRADFDVTSPAPRPWKQYSAIINCAAYNDVNSAETDRAGAWAVNAEAPAQLARIAAANSLTLVHVSSDYIFDGSQEVHTEEELPSPLSAYGASKAAGETAARTAPRHFVIRTSWVFGDGPNFMGTMRALAAKNVQPKVIHDQRGRPTFAEDLAKGIIHLLRTEGESEYGVYNISNSGDVVGRDEIAMAVFTGVGHDPSEVTPVSTEQYREIAGPEAPRPKESTLSLDKIQATGFTPMNWRAALALYLGLYPA